MISPVADAAVPEIHAGKDETSVMLALAPELVRRERIADLKAPPDGDAVRAADPRSGDELALVERRQAHRRSGRDRRCAAASAEHGRAIVTRVVEAAGAVLKQLLDNGHHTEYTATLAAP